MSKRTTIEIAMQSLAGDVKPRSIEAQVFGQWAVHGPVTPYDCAVAITHVPTGSRLPMLDMMGISEHDALAIARRLGESVVMTPEESSACIEDMKNGTRSPLTVALADRVRSAVRAALVEIKRRP